MSLNILETLDRANKELAVKITIAENNNDLKSFDYKEELFRNKLEMISILKSEIAGEKSTTTTLAEEIKVFQSQPIRPKYATGINVIDTRFNGGLELSQLVLVGGEKGAGKTSIALQFLLNISEGFKTCFYSFEMPKWKIAQRLLKSNPTRNQTSNFNLHADGRDIADIERSVKKLAKEDTKFFVIDSLMKITNTTFKTKNEQVSDITSRISRLCVELDIIIVLIVQVSKDDLKTGHMAVKGSGDADYDADIMFFIQRDKKDEIKRILICDKNRQNGNEFKEELYFNNQTVALQGYKPSVCEIEYTTSKYTFNDNIQMAGKI